MQLGVGNEELGIVTPVADCRVRHEDGHTHSAGICAVCGRYVMEVAIILYFRGKVTIFFRLTFLKNQEWILATILFSN